MRAVHGLAELRRTGGVDAAHLNFNPGDPIPLTQDLGTLLAVVLVSGPDTETVDRLLANVRSTVRLELT